MQSDTHTFIHARRYTHTYARTHARTYIVCSSDIPDSLVILNHQNVYLENRRHVTFKQEAHAYNNFLPSSTAEQEINY